MVIYKYPLEITDYQFITVGDRKANPLSVAEQNGKLCIWVSLDENYAAGGETMEISIVGTGNRQCGALGDFVGTVLMSNGLVWHVFAN